MKIPICRPELPKFEEIENELKDILKSGMVTNHKYVKMLEQKVAKCVGTKYAIAVSSGQSGLMLTLKCLELPKGSKIITPSYTFVATANAIKWAGFEPLFVDVEERTANLNPYLIKDLIVDDGTIKAIMPVHLYGNPCRTREFRRLYYNSLRFKLIYDSAHAFGSSVGKFGDAEVFSMAATKIITAGEGGIITTNNSELAEKLRGARDYGNFGMYENKIVGLSAKMSELNAIIGLKNFEKIDENLTRRKTIAVHYMDELDGLVDFLEYSKNPTHYLFPIFTDKRDKLFEVLNKEGIGARRNYFNPPVHKQPAYKEYANLKLPVTEKLARTVLCLPIYPSLKDEEVDKICKIVKREIK